MRDVHVADARIALDGLRDGQEVVLAAFEDLSGQGPQKVEDTRI